MNSRAWNDESSVNFCENFTFTKQQDRKMCQYHRFKVALSTGSQTL